MATCIRGDERGSAVPSRRKSGSSDPAASASEAPAADPPEGKPYHHGNLQTALVKAARELLAESGAESLSLRSVARAAGVSQAAPYHHFGSKEALLAAVATEGFQQVAADQAEIERAEPDPTSRVRALGRYYIRFARRNPQLFTLMFGPVIRNREHYPELTEAYSRCYSFIEAATAQQLEQIEGDTPPVAIAVATAWSLVHGLSHLLNDEKIRPGENGLPGEEELVDALLDVLRVGMLGPR